MLKKIGTVLVFFFIVVAIAAIFFGVRFWRYSKRIESTTIEEVDISQVANGTYRGKTNFMLVSAEVEVAVQDGRITEFNIINHEHGPRYSGAPITARVLEEQSLQVDIITGATASSKAILKAAENALREGLAAQSDTPSSAMPDTAQQNVE